MTKQGRAFRLCHWRTFCATVSVVALAFALANGTAVAADLEAGREKAAQCAVCHGMDGLGKRPDAPNLAGQNDFYMAEQLRHYRSGTRQHETMTIIAEGLSDEDIADLSLYYASIKITVEVP